MLDPFEQRRQQVLDQLSSDELDKSRAGGVDARIKVFMASVNTHADLYTTSSCSGRISVFAEPSAQTRAAGMKGGAWVYATHDLADLSAVLDSIHKGLASGSKLIFRFEPFILAVECRDMAIAQQLVAVAREAGFRESGVTASKARTIAGIRCSLRLEVPLADQGKMLVSQEYLQRYLVEFSNEKMQTNWDRTHRFETLFAQRMLAQPAPQATTETASGKASRKPKSKQYEAEPTTSQHLSRYAVQQLLAQGVSQQTLDQIQAGKATAAAHQQSAADKQPTDAGHFRQPKCSAKSKKHQQLLSSGAAGLRARQDRIFSRISSLEQQAADSSPASLRWQEPNIELQGLSGSTLQRWGHTTTAVGDKLIIFGGYGGAGAHSRTADLLVFDLTSQQLTARPADGPQPPPRMGHTAVLISTSLIIFGGRDSPAHPLSDVWVLDTVKWQWLQASCKGDGPEARFRHTAVAAGSTVKEGNMLMHGGYNGKDVLGDTWELHTGDWSWHQSRFTAALLGSHMYIHGGTSDYTHTHADLHALDLATGQWQCLTDAAAQGAGEGAAPPPCFSHSLTAAGDLLVVAGGCHTHGAGHIHTYQPSSNQWSKHDVQHGDSLVLCRHTATAHGQQLYCLGGGMNCFGFGTTFSPPMQLDLTSLQQQSSQQPADSPDSQLPSGKTLAPAAVPILASSTKGNKPGTSPGGSKRPPQVNWKQAGLHPMRHADNAVDQATQPQTYAPAVSSASTVNYAVTPGVVSGRDQDEQVKMSFAVPKAHAKVAKDSLRALSWLDRSCKAQTDSAGNICLPLTDPGYKHLALHQPKAQDSGLTQSVTPVQNGLARSGTPVQNGPAQSVTPVQNGCSPEGGCTLLTQHSSHASAEQERSVKPNAQETASPDAPSPSGMLTSRTASEHVGPMSDREAHGTSKQHVLSLKQCRSCLMDLMANSVATLQPLSSVAPAKSGMGPAARLRLHVQQLLQQQAVSEQQTAALLVELPLKWEKLGDLALLPHHCMLSPSWASLIPNMWEVVCHALGVRRLARQAPVANTGTRDSQAELLLGENGWVQHKEGSVLYSLDVTKCMFSSGNTTVRQRMGQLDCTGETVLDLYAGIGYYTLPFLVKAGAAKVIACEWNPRAVEALHKNLELNGVAERCEVLVGDNTATAPKGVADRVSLGLLPSSEGGWPVALSALKPGGGWLHLHQNVTDFQEQEWCQATIVKLQSLAEQQGRLWHFRLCKVERVKWYAPHIRHVVLDIHVLPQADVHTEEDT